MTGINLDVILGESEDKPLVYKGQTFMLPAELPGDVLAPFLDPKLGLIELVSDALSNADDDDEWTDVVFKALKARPSLPTELLDAIKDAFASLLGEHYGPFMALRPSVPAYFAIGKGLVDVYGVGLTDFFDSADSSQNDGTSSKPTSPTTTPDTTPEASGDDQATPDS